MAETKVICPNCGIIKRIEMACMWLGRPPMPEIEDAFCPRCGAKTVIERGKEPSSVSWNSKSNDQDYKKREIDYYRDKYKREFGLE